MEDVAEVDGPRVRKLHAAFEKTLEKSLNGFTREKFLQCFENSEFTDETKLLDELKSTLESSLRVLMRCAHDLLIYFSLNLKLSARIVNL